MKKNDLNIFLTLSLSVLIPVPARLAYGIVMILTLNICLILGILLKHLIGLFFSDDLQNALLVTILTGICILLKQFLIIISPVMALTLGFMIFFPALTSFVMGRLYVNNGHSLKTELKTSTAKCGIYSGFAFFFFLIRDIAGYGTITLPSTSGIFELDLWQNSDYAFFGAFFASIPGGIFLLVISFYLFNCLLRNFEIFETANGEIDAE